MTEASCIYTLQKAPWLNWIEQPPPKGQVAGSNPAGVANKYVVKKYFLIGHQTTLPARAETKKSSLLPIKFLPR